MRVAIYGGSFNPPHVVHGMVAAWLLWTGQVEQVWLVPVYRHAFESWHGKALAPFEARVRWCEALARDVDPRVQVSTIEAELPVPSYTISTLRALAARHPEHRFRLVVGADVLQQSPKWRAWDEIAAEFAPIAVGRAGYPSPPGGVVFPELSSTEIRARLAAGEPIDGLVTRGVLPLLQETA